MPLWPSPFSKAGFWDGVSNTARGPGVEHACLPNRSQRRERRRSDSGCGAQFLFHPNNSGGKTPRWIADASSCLGRCWVVSQTRADGSGVPRGERFFFFSELEVVQNVRGLFLFCMRRKSCRLLSGSLIYVFLSKTKQRNTNDNALESRPIKKKKVVERPFETPGNSVTLSGHEAVGADETGGIIPRRGKTVRMMAVFMTGRVEARKKLFVLSSSKHWNWVGLIWPTDSTSRVEAPRIAQKY